MKHNYKYYNLLKVHRDNMVNIPNELIKVHYKGLKKLLTRCQETKQYAKCIELSSELRCIEFFLLACQGDPEAKELLDLFQTEMGMWDD